MSRVFGFLLALLLNGALVIAQDAPTTQPVDSKDLSDARAAAIEFAMALGDADTKQLKKLFAGTEKDWALVESMHAVMKASRELDAAMEQQFPGQEIRKFARRFEPDRMANELERLPFKIDGNRATFAERGFLLERVDRQWKVTRLMVNEKEADRAGQEFATVLEVLPAVTADIKAGVFDSPQAAYNAMNERRRNARPRPSTMPVDR